ncbi:MAG: sigma-70 family RNA polymerase sigma factor [bacterium]
MDSEKELIDRCLNRDPKAQESLYSKYASRMFGICLRYAGDGMEAQDMLQEGFIRAFRYLKDYRFEGSFEGWLQRVFVNTAINIKRKGLKFQSEDSTDEKARQIDTCEDAISKLSQQELMQMIRELPTGYRMVFNLFVIEGFSHKEIGKLLGISESTSKSQLWCAKRSLRMRILKNGYGDGRTR